jgi:YidC/Oxa1 family membrane protein insertase
MLNDLSMEKRALIATVISIAILLGYQLYVAQYDPAPKPEAPKAAPEPPPAPPAAAAPPPAARPGLAPAAAEKLVAVETDLLGVRLSTRGARATAWRLTKYRDKEDKAVDLVAGASGPGAAAPLLLVGEDQGLPGLTYAADRDRLELTEPGASGTITFTAATPAGLAVEKRVTFRSGSYRAEVEVRLRNTARTDLPAGVRLVWGPGFRTPSAGDPSQPQLPTAWVDGKRIQDDPARLKEEAVHAGGVSWVALHDTYFTASLLAGTKDAAAVIGKAAAEAGETREKRDEPVIGLATRAVRLAPGAEAGAQFAVYGGPKDVDLLKGAGSGLDDLLDFGFIDTHILPLARPALYLLKFLNGLTGSYGLAIIILTVLIKAAFHPLTMKGLRSMQAMQALQPRMAAIQEKYKNNPKKRQEEMMGLYRRHGANPMGGCLPMLLQVPIFIALYNALSASVELWRAPFLWISDLSAPEDGLFTLWGGIEFRPLPLLMGASMFVQQKMTPTTGDPRQAQMLLYMMPTLFTFMFWGFPSGLVLYWLVNNGLQILQQHFFLKKRLPGPAATEPAEA